jgi:hypothetical protein
MLEAGNLRFHPRSEKSESAFQQDILAIPMLMKA